MKFRDTVFARQLAALTVGLVLAVASVAFVTIPASLGVIPGGSVQAAAAQTDWHPT